MLGPVAAALAALGAMLIVAGLVALWRAKPLSFAARTLAGLVLCALGAAAGAVAVGIEGYRALTREEVAAHIVVRPTAPQRFAAMVRLPDGRELNYDLAGDELYLDAHVLKWKPIANLIGLHTAYELDRIAGRYRSVDDERSALRTVYPLAPVRLVDLFELRRRYAFLSALLDADYGSASFVPVNAPAELELRVSTSGLLLRPAARP